jgi:lipoprotein-anchoring transpeptidase ErfK/SrfK
MIRVSLNRGRRCPVASMAALGFLLVLQPPVAQAQTRLASLSDAASSGAANSRAKKTQSERAAASLSGYSPGTIVVRTSQRRLYYVLGDGHVLTYTVGVGRLGKQWSGQSMISGKYIKPAWSPPDEIRRDNPRLPSVIPSGAPGNPMGAAAMTIAGGEYAIHGTNRPGSIGGFVSYGCIRMRNADIMDLFARVSVGTPVVVER